MVSIYGDNKTLSCLSAEELRGSEIEDRSNLFVNWASVNKSDNRLRRDESGSETGRTLHELLETTRTAGRKIGLVVDESHRDVNGVQAQLVVQNIIAPDLTLEISATPVLKDYDLRVTILREDVFAAGVIRKQFVINPGVGGTLSIQDGVVRIGEPGSAKLLLDVAIAHRKKVAEAYASVGVSINPVILVQLPDKGEPFAAQVVVPRLLVDPLRALQWVDKETWHYDRTSERLDDGSYVLEVPYSNDQELVMDLLRHSPEVEVLGPPELREQLHAVLCAAASKPPGRRSVGHSLS